MIMSQERAFLKAQEELDALEAYVEQAADSGSRIDQVERELFGRLLNLGRTLLTAFVASQGDGDAGSELETADGRRVRRMPELHERRYLSIFGELQIPGGGFTPNGRNGRCSALRWTNGSACPPASSRTSWRIGSSGCV